MSEGTNWLHHFLRLAVRKGFCTKIMCTTCGAQDFRIGLIREAMKQAGRDDEPKLDGALALEVVRALATLRPDESEVIAFEGALRLVLVDVHSVLFMDFPSRVEADRLLVGTWAGSVEARMKAHEAVRREARRARSAYESPEAVQARREEKKRRKEAEQQVRAARKLERDRLWRERNVGDH